MNAHEFYKLANENLSENPMDRVPDEMKEIILNSDNDSIDRLFFDVHTHCFTYDNVPAGFPGTGVYIPRVILDFLGEAVNVFGYIRRFVGFSERSYWSSYAKKRFLERFIDEKSSDAILMHQISRYKLAFKQMDRPIPWIIMTELMMDMERGIKGKVRHNFYHQLAEVDKLRELRQHKKVILPFFAADPKNPNLYEDFLAVFTDVDKKINRTGRTEFQDTFPFFGVKLYPCLGYFPSDPRLIPLFKICEKKNIPITSHCGGASTRYNKTKYLKGERLILDFSGKEVSEKYKINMNPLLKKKEKIIKTFNAPNNWLPVLRRFPNLKLNLAHFGGNQAWDNYRKGRKNTHINQALDIITGYERVYADFSFACAFDRNLIKINEWFSRGVFPYERQEILKRKVLYGSDYYLTDSKKSLITITKSIFEEFDGALVNQFCLQNPKEFLFST